MDEDETPPLSARLTELHEKARSGPLSVDDAERAFGDREMVERLLSLEERGFIALPIVTAYTPKLRIEADRLRAELNRRLRDKLAAGELVATGFPEGGGNHLVPVALPAEMWTYAELFAWGDDAVRDGKVIVRNIRISTTSAEMERSRIGATPTASNNQGKATAAVVAVSQAKRGRPRSHAGTRAREIAHEMLLHHGAGFHQDPGDTLADRERELAERLEGEGFTLSDSQIRAILHEVAADISADNTEKS
ncbi:hypothetical protein AA12717_2572 [Gluconacetobacter sacchari DSM 12717]|uniref:Uncharacterized protein n=2 Tax=Gluconacetobacter sacchari TaxID=92759 RepID=A0A7W4IBV3_9PROT|nr:hypothetical protein [Gluconacetobacter sacchari]MBB2159947.1 hypothetical protein [Gluconacetobacter sacchari]GBQ27123.1 hypothetical protein AA12717_2572 [Gluconacetobacter sacchari DSM 12717]